MLLDDIAAWQIYFYRGNAWTNAQSSADLRLNAAAPAAGAPRAQLPTGVRVVLTMQGGAEGVPPRTLTRDLLLAPQLP
jgi:general secretion pathway protein J